MLARVRARLVALISDAEDVIHIYPICGSSELSVGDRVLSGGCG